MSNVTDLETTVHRLGNNGSALPIAEYWKPILLVPDKKTITNIFALFCLHVRLEISSLDILWETNVLSFLKMIQT